MAVRLVVLTPGELITILLLVEDILGRKAWHFAALQGKNEALDLLLDWSIKLLIPEDTRKKVLLSTLIRANCQAGVGKDR
jgi:hypothetical protein